MKIGVVFGNPETTTGGNALKFYSSVRMEIRRTSNLKDGEAVVGTRAKVKVVKNKVAPPFQEAEFDLLYGVGIHRAGEVLDLGVQSGLVDKAGSHFSLRGERIGQGRERASEWLREHPEAMEALARELVGRALPVPTAPSPAEHGGCSDGGRLGAESLERHRHREATLTRAQEQVAPLVLLQQLAELVLGVPGEAGLRPAALHPAGEDAVRAHGERGRVEHLGDAIAQAHGHPLVPGDVHGAHLVGRVLHLDVAPVLADLQPVAAALRRGRARC